MTTDDTTTRIVHLVARQLDVPEATVTPEASFDELGADSLDRAELVLTLETTFALEITDDDAERCARVRDLVALVDRAADRR